jgi:hypothetical protein
VDRISPTPLVLRRSRFGVIFRRAWLVFRLILVIAILIPVTVRSQLAPANTDEQVRAYTRSEEFDYVSWTANALLGKIGMSTIGFTEYLTPAADHKLVIEYLDLVRKSFRLEETISAIYADPDIQLPYNESLPYREQLRQYAKRMNQIGPTAEAVLQSQVTTVVNDKGLGFGGQPIPPIWYQTTPLPLALIISPRTVIRSESDISLLPEMSMNEITALEDQVSKNLNVSALVVEVGGIGIYPTMVQQTDDLTWLAQTISHEWTHNYLTLRPLGLSYDASPELRTMNETTASIAGSEIGMEVIRRYYPGLIPPASDPTTATPLPEKTAAPSFDFRAEMHITRVKVDQLLAEGKVTDAENYMETQRRFFYAHGYPIRKLNQAYFAFYGAYADQPGGAAGEDPVGPAVRALRQHSPALAAFMQRIAVMTSFQQLKDALK